MHRSSDETYCNIWLSLCHYCLRCSCELKMCPSFSEITVNVAIEQPQYLHDVTTAGSLLCNLRGEGNISTSLSHKGTRLNAGSSLNTYMLQWFIYFCLPQVCRQARMPASMLCHPDLMTSTTRARLWSSSSPWNMSRTLTVVEATLNSSLLAWTRRTCTETRSTTSCLVSADSCCTQVLWERSHPDDCVVLNDSFMCHHSNTRI